MTAPELLLRGSVDEQIRNVIRDWMLEYASPGGRLGDDVVIPAEQSWGPTSRPPLPYCTVRVGTPVALGTPMILKRKDADGAGWRWTRIVYETSVSIQGYGAGVLDWILRLTSTLWLEERRDYLAARMLTVLPDGNPINVASLIDTGFEPRWSQDLTVRFCLDSEEERIVPLRYLVLDGKMVSDQSDGVDISGSFDSGETPPTSGTGQIGATFVRVGLIWPLA